MMLAKFYHWSLNDIENLTIPQWNGSVSFIKEYQREMKKASKKRR